MSQTLFAGVDNVLDEDPPLLPPGTASGQLGIDTSGIYPVRGRFFYLGVRLNF